MSGLGFLSGWKCNSGTITLSVEIGDTPQTFTAVSGLPRADTAAVCGGAADNGFLTQINWNWLGTGEHTVVAADNGVEFARATFTVTRLSDTQEFVPDLSAMCAVPDFPTPGVNAAFA